MELEISKYLLNMNPKNTREDIIEDRDRVLQELKNDYQKYKDIIDKLFKRRIKYKGTIVSGIDVEYSFEIVFEPVSFSLSRWGGKFMKILRCNVVIYNFSVIDDGEENSLKDYMKDNLKSSIPQVMMSTMGGSYIIKDQFQNYAKLLGLGDYEVDILNINNIIFRYD